MDRRMLRLIQMPGHRLQQMLRPRQQQKRIPGRSRSTGSGRGCPAAAGTGTGGGCCGDSGAGNCGKSEEELQKVINEAPELSDTTNVQESDLTKIIISGTISLTNTVTIPANKGIAIVGEDENAKIERADSYAGNLFDVNGILYMAKRDVMEGAGTLSVDGSVEGETQVTGSLVHVASGAKFAMTTGITLTNNTTTARGAAIFNEGGTVQITGGQISNNHSDGGAVYSTGMILVKKGDGAADTEPTITGNTKTDGQTAANVVLAGTDGKLLSMERSRLHRSVFL